MWDFLKECYRRIWFFYRRRKPYFKVFFYGFLIDLAYVVWMKAVTTGNPFLAGLASVVVATPSILGFLEIITNKKLIYFYLLGLFMGTVFATVYLT